MKSHLKGQYRRCSTALRMVPLSTGCFTAMTTSQDLRVTSIGASQVETGRTGPLSVTSQDSASGQAPATTLHRSTSSSAIRNSQMPGRMYVWSLADKKLQPYWELLVYESQYTIIIVVIVIISLLVVLIKHDEM